MKAYELEGQAKEEYKTLRKTQQLLKKIWKDFYSKEKEKVSSGEELFELEFLTSSVLFLIMVGQQQLMMKHDVEFTEEFYKEFHHYRQAFDMYKKHGEDFGHSTNPDLFKTFFMDEETFTPIKKNPIGFF